MTTLIADTMSNDISPTVEKYALARDSSGAVRRIKLTSAHPDAIQTLPNGVYTFKITVPTGANAPVVVVSATPAYQTTVKGTSVNSFAAPLMDTCDLGSLGTVAADQPVVITDTYGTLATVPNPALSSVPNPVQLSSLPGAPATVFLNFGGYTVKQWGEYYPGVTPPFSLDADTATFNEEEKIAIRNAWTAVAEAFSPFNVNVTTVDPGSMSNPNVIMVIIGGDGAWYPSSSTVGIAFINSYGSPYVSREAFVFSKKFGTTADSAARNIGRTAPHEVGHTLGLQHQSDYDASGTKTYEYGRGANGNQPIMGQGSGIRNLWWRGPNSVSASTIQDDVQVISGTYNNFGFRADDHSNVPDAATALKVDTSGNISGSGVISKLDDADFFKFTTDGGPLNISVNTVSLRPMLDAKLFLFDAAGRYIAGVDTASAGEMFSNFVVPRGTYSLYVGSHGSYGDIGGYTLTGTIVPYAPGCIRGVPLLQFSPASQTVPSGKGAPYVLTVTNQDSSMCGPSSFAVAASEATGKLVTAVSSPSVVVQPRGQAAVIVSAYSMKIGTYTLRAAISDPVGVAGHSASSTTITTVVADKTAPTVPQQLAIQYSVVKELGKLNAYVTLTWLPSSDNAAVAHYRVYRNTNLLPDIVPGTSYTHKIGTRGSYVFQVVAVDVNGNTSGKSNKASFSF